MPAGRKTKSLRQVKYLPGRKTKSLRQVKYLLSEGSPLTSGQRQKLKREIKRGSVKVKKK